jgi:hypothetical protein
MANEKTSRSRTMLTSDFAMLIAEFDGGSYQPAAAVSSI